MPIDQRPETGFAIPDDWDGESWQCISLQWPDSTEYNWLLRSLLYLLTRGREWAADTGVIKEAQTAGRSIYERNFDLTPCGAGDECEPTDETVRKLLDQLSGALAMASGMECDCMGCAVDKIAWVRAGGGLKLAYRICGRWAMVGEVTPGEIEEWCIEGLDVETIVPDIPDDGEPAEPEEPEIDSVPCQVATLIAEKIWEINEWWWDNRDKLPLEFYWDVQKAFPEVSWRWTLTEPAHVLWAATYVSGGGFDDQFKPDKLQELKCRLRSSFRDLKTYTLESKHWNRITDAVWNALGADEALTTTAMLGASGFDDWKNYAKKASVVDPATLDCSCPDDQGFPTYAYPTASGWYLGDPLPINLEYGGDPGWARWIAEFGAQEHDVMGYMIFAERTGEGPSLKRMYAETEETAAGHLAEDSNSMEFPVFNVYDIVNDIGGFQEEVLTPRQMAGTYSAAGVFGSGGLTGSPRPGPVTPTLALDYGNDKAGTITGNVWLVFNKNSPSHT